MKLFSVWCLSILLVSCSGAPASPPKLPESASFGWKLKDIAVSNPDAAPDSIRALGFEKSWRAEYTGPGVANVDIYALKSEAAGLEMTQKWRPLPQTVTVFNAHYFVVIHWQTADNASATALVGQIERSLPRSQ